VAARHDRGNTCTYNVGGSPRYFTAGLLVAWFSYSNMLSLLVADEATRELDALYARDLRAFATVIE
jgi:hypothetical protein